MLHEKPVTSMARKREKSRRQSSSSDAPTATAQGHQAPISYAKDHQGPITDMAIDQPQDYALLPRMESVEEEEKTKELFGPEVILSEQDQASFVKLLPPDMPPPSSTRQMSWEDNYKLLERHGRLRIAYYKAVMPEFVHQHKDTDAYYEDEIRRLELKDLDAYSDDEIRQQNYFEHLENQECFEWFFHTDDRWNPDLDDYQRIVLRNFMPGCIGPQYPDVNFYHECYHTYEMDAVYVNYYGEISKKIKWLEEYSHLDEKSTEWTDIRIRGWRQALRIATQLPDMTLSLASLAFDEYISELREDASLKDLDLVYFLIWRLVVKDNRSYMDAVKEVYDMDKFHIHKRAMDVELKEAPAFLTMREKIHIITWRAGISANTEDDEARVLFRKGLAHFKTKYMVNYAEKKLEIAKRLNWHKSIEIPGRIEAPEQIEMSWKETLSNRPFFT